MVNVKANAQGASSNLPQEWKDEEEAVLRECLFVLQGVDGDERLFWKFNSDDSSKLHPQHLLAEEKLTCSSTPVLSKQITTALPASWVGQSRLGSGAMDALSLCAEAGWLYQRVQLYVDSVRQNNSAGSIARALACGFSQELKEYLEFLAQLEQQIEHLHLRQIQVRMRVPIYNLRTLAILADSLQHLTGGPLLAALYRHIKSGDMRHVKLTNRLLDAASKPWYHMLHQWTTQGILSDPAQEFFVQPNLSETTAADERFAWSEGFVLDHAKLPGPGIMDLDLVEPAFRVGKGVNFVRRCLMDGEWSFGQDLIERARKSFCYNSRSSSESNQFRSALTEAMRIVHSHILESLRSEHNLMMHLYALKQFMFLGQGDFYSALMEGLSAEFGDKIGVFGIYKHHLAAVVEASLQDTNASDFPSHVLNRLEAVLNVEEDQLRHAFGSEMVGSSSSQNQRVWDIFSLKYAVPESLSAIVDGAAKDDYLRVFHFLFGLKTVEHHLNATWRQSATLYHALSSVAQQNGLSAQTSQPYAQSMALMRQISMTRQAMNHFVVNFKSYLMFEVLEGGWDQLLQDIQEAETLDDIVLAHSHYIKGICQKSLLAKESASGAVAEDSRLSDLGDLIGELMELCNEFCEVHQMLFDSALEAADRAKEMRRRAGGRQEQGTWGFASEEEAAEERNFFGLADFAKQKEAEQFADAFHQKIAALLVCTDEILNGVSLVGRSASATPGSPHKQEYLQIRSNRDDGHLDSLRFLAFQLDQNNYYEKHHSINSS